MTATKSPKKAQPLSWKPIRSGERYCSPACGRCCSWTEYRRAHRRAAALCKQLGPRWKPEVYENLGWQYNATYVRPGIYFGVHEFWDEKERRPTAWQCYIDDEGPGGRWVGHSQVSPLDAVNDGIAKLTDSYEQIRTILIAAHKVTAS